LTPGVGFKERVIAAVSKVPLGKVVSYGQVAAYAGRPRAARAVGWMLKSGVDVPWWRVINNSGRISIKDNWEHEAAEQKELLEAEGVEVGEDWSVEIEKYRFRASMEQMRRWE